jgi:hypothetical protein
MARRPADLLEFCDMSVPIRIMSGYSMSAPADKSRVGLNLRAPSCPVSSSAIGVDGIPAVTLKGQGTQVALELHGLAVLTRSSRLVFELDGLDDFNGQMECLKTLQRFTKPQLGAITARPLAVTSGSIRPAPSSAS